jgi:hypothetical protein
MKTKHGRFFSGVVRAAVVAFVAAIFSFSLLGCPADGSDPVDPSPGPGPGPGPSATRLVSGKMGSAASRSIYRASRGVSRNVTPADVDDVPFILDTDPDVTAPAGMTALKGKVQAEGENGNIVIILTGVLDNTSGEFVAAGVDSEGLGIGFQIEGVFKNNAVSGVKITVKTKEMEQTADFGEWVEEETEWQNVDAEVTATETADHQEEGLPAAWTGKYVSLADADDWKDTINMYLGYQYTDSAPTGTEGISVGEAVGDIFAEDGNVFVLVAPMAWSYVIDFATMDNSLSARLTEKGFTAASEIMGKLHAAMAIYEKLFYCSFLEVAQGDPAKEESNQNVNGNGKEDPDAYYALALNISPNFETGEELGRFFTRYKIFSFNDGLGVEGMTNNRDQLVLSPAYDLTYTWPPIGDLPASEARFICRTAEEARNGKQFTGDTAMPWIFGRE